MSDQPPFEPDFADPTEWATMYRDHGLQVVPAMSHRESPKSWKRPALPKWRALEHELAAHVTVELWHFENGERSGHDNTSARVPPATPIMGAEIFGGLFRRHPDRRVVAR